MKTCRIFSLVLLLVTAGASPAWSQRQDDDFEAAMRKVPSETIQAGGRAGIGNLRPRAPGPADRYIAYGESAPRLAPQGTIPAKWRDLKEITDKVWYDLNDDISAGKLDGVALLERVTQPLPLPTGAILVECNRQSMQFDYTMNADLPADLSRRLAIARQTSSEPLQEEAEREAAPMIQSLAAFFLAKGFRPFRSGIVPSTSFYNERTRLRVDIMNTSVDDVDSSCAPFGVKVPDGPFLRYSNHPMEKWENFIPEADLKKPYRHRQKAKVEKVDPFG